MKLGFVTAILDSWTYEEMMDFASEQGFECVEVACWPQEKAERRYAGVSHIDAERVNQDDTYAEHIVEYAKKSGVEISSLAYYPNVMAADKEKSAAAVEHLKQVILASKKLGVGMVTTFIGRDQTKNVQENLELVKEIWPPIIKLAEECDVKVAIENCPMLFGEDQWPGGQNLMTTPPIWREVFRILDSDHLGINYDPSHFIWQMIDYIRPLYEFKDKIFHVHYKDIRSTKTSWNPAVSWHIHWNTCHRSSRDSEMWTGENMYQHLRISDMTVIHALRSRTRPLKIPRKRLRIL